MQFRAPRDIDHRVNIRYNPHIRSLQEVPYVARAHGSHQEELMALSDRRKMAQDLE